MTHIPPLSCAEAEGARGYQRNKKIQRVQDFIHTTWSFEEVFGHLKGILPLQKIEYIIFYYHYAFFSLSSL